MRRWAAWPRHSTRSRRDDDRPVPGPADRQECDGALPPARAFALFAGDFGRWWPVSQVHTGPDPADCAIEPRVGGRVFERSADGRETAWGTVLAYDPPHRLAFSWIVELPAGVEQLVEIRFTAEDRGTRVELTHSGWEKLGDAAASLRERYDRGWGRVFERYFVDYASSVAI